MPAITDTSTPSEDVVQAVTAAGEKHAVQGAICNKDGGFLSQSHAVVEEMHSGSFLKEEETEESETVLEGILRRVYMSISSHRRSIQMPGLLPHAWISTDMESVPRFVAYLENCRRQVGDQMEETGETEGTIPPTVRVKEEDMLSDVVLSCEPKECGTVHATLRCHGKATPQIVAE